ncbi:MAG: MBL fold metallo-hydrolase [Blastocatellia bacterium]
MKALIVVLALLFLSAAVKLSGAPQQDFSKVEMKPTKVAGNVYMLEGSGGNIGVSVGPEGVLIIDDQFAPLADKIRGAFRSLAQGQPDNKLRYVLNTHWHGDHTGSNAIFGQEAPIIAHINVRNRLSAAASTAKSALPVVTYDKGVSVHFNGEEIRLTHYPNGHTDGDTIIYFTKSNVVHMGDHMMTGRFPYVDFGSGGSVEGIERNIGAVIKALPADVKVIPGHGPLATLDDIKAYHGVLVETMAIVRKHIAAGKSLDDVKKAGLPDKYQSWGSGFINTDRWLETLYKGLSAK